MVLRCAVPLLVHIFNQTERRPSFVLASSRLTHRSWQAETAALAIAECAALAIQTEQRNPEVSQLLNILAIYLPEAEWQQWLARIESSLAAELSVSEFLRSAGLTKGITGYALHVVQWRSTPGCDTQVISAPR